MGWAWCRCGGCGGLMRMQPDLLERRIDDGADPGNPVGCKPGARGVRADQRLVLGEVNAVHLVVGDVALHPLDPRAEGPEDPTRLLRDGLELREREPPGTGDVALDDELGHVA